MSNSHADRLAEQIKRALRPGQFGVLADIDELVALAKQQASQEERAAVGLFEAMGLPTPELPKVPAAQSGEVFPIPRFNLDASIDGVDQFREFVLASDHDAVVHALETNCDPAGTVRELAQANDVIRELSASNRLLRDTTPSAPQCEQAAGASCTHHETRCSTYVECAASGCKRASAPSAEMPADAFNAAYDEIAGRAEVTVRKIARHCWEAALSQGTTPAVGVGEQAQAEPMSALQAAYDRLHNDGFKRIEDWFIRDENAPDTECIHIDTIALIAEAGIKEKTNG